MRTLLQKQTEEYKRQLQMLRTTESLGKILRDFLRKSYNEHVNLSWKASALVRCLSSIAFFKVNAFRLQKRLNPGKFTPLRDSTVGNEANTPKHRKPIMEPEPYKPPSGRYSSGLESLDEVISTFIWLLEVLNVGDCSETRHVRHWRDIVA